MKIEQTPEKHQKEEATTGDEPKGVSKSVNQAEVVKEIRNDTDDESLEWTDEEEEDVEIDERGEEVIEIDASIDEDYAINPNLTEDDKRKLRNLINNNVDSFAKSFMDIGKTDKIELNIELTSTEPVACRPYRLPYTQRDIVKGTVGELLQAGIMRPSKSSYASPVVLVGKRTGGERMCIDYRRLNSVTKKEYVPPMCVDEQLDHLSKKKYFTSLDFASGYYQVPVAEESRHLTAFVTDDGVFEFERMPFGLVNAPSVFNRLMRTVFADLVPDVITIYMDDILIASETVEEGLEKLDCVFRVLRQEGLTLNPRKCRFLFESVEYLGIEIDRDGVRPGRAKIDAVKEFKRPENVHEVRQFLGLTGFFSQICTKLFANRETLKLIN